MNDKINKVIDSAIALISPKSAFKRQQYRAAMAISSGYDGARRNRAALRGYNVQSADVNTDTIADLPTLRDRSSDLYRNDLTAAGAINTMLNYIVGRGLSVIPSIDPKMLGLTQEQADRWCANTMERFELWYGGTHNDCDIQRMSNGYQLQSIAFLGMLIHGDSHVLCTTHIVNGVQVPALQIIEAPQICNENLVIDTPNLIAGVEVNDQCRPLRYHVCNQHPSVYNQKTRKWSKVDAFNRDTEMRNILPLFDRTRANQVRGIPVLAPLIEPLKQLKRFAEAELQAAVISGMFAVFTTVDPAAFTEIFDDAAKGAYLDSASAWDGSFGEIDSDSPGKAVRLLPGESVNSPAPGRPNAAFDPFFMAILKQIGSYLGLPVEMLVKHYTSSYTASRAAMLDAWKMFSVRRQTLADMHCQPIYEYWLYWEVAAGKIAAPGFLSNPETRKLWCASYWIGDGMGAINPIVEANAAQKRIDIGISTVDSESIAYDGIPSGRKHAQRLKEVARLAELDKIRNADKKNKV